MSLSIIASQPLDRRDCVAAAALVGITFAVFVPSLRCGFVNLDDPYYVTYNSNVRDGLSLAGARWAFTATQPFYWQPLTLLSLQLDASLWGLSARGFHLTNVLLHAGNAGLLFLALRSLTGEFWRSAAAALLFAVHPLRVESVTWVSERKDVLSMFFALLSLWAYAEYLRRRSAWWYLTLLASLELSLLAKPMLLTLPFLLLLLDWWPLGRWPGQGTWPLVREKVPLLVLIALFIALTARDRMEKGVAADFEGLTVVGRAENAAVSYVAYLGKTIWPAHLAAFYPHPFSTYNPNGGLPVWKVAGAALLLASLTAVAVALRRRAPYVLAGWLWYVGTLAPVIGLVTQPGRHAYADRFSYMSQIGVLVAVCWGVADLIANRTARAVLAVGAAAALAAVTWNQVDVWRDSVTLWRHALKITGPNTTNLMHLGDALADQGQDAEAIHCYQGCEEIAPDFPDAYVNLGNLLSRSGKLDDAEQQYNQALRIDPGLADVYCNVGMIDIARGNPERAAGKFRKALQLQPGSAIAHSSLGSVLFSQGKLGEAEKEQLQAIRLEDLVQAHHNLGSIYFQQGKFAEAAREFETVIRHIPGQYGAHFHLGEAEAARGNLDRAADCYQEAFRLRPDSGEAQDGLTGVLLKQGQLQKASTIVREALGRNPHDGRTRDNLGRVLEAAGELDGAAREYETATQLSPNHARAWYDHGRARGRQGRQADAAACFEKAIEKEPSSAQFRRALQEARQAQDRSGGAGSRSSGRSL